MYCSASKNSGVFLCGSLLFSLCSAYPSIGNFGNPPVLAWNLKRLVRGAARLVL